MWISALFNQSTGQVFGLSCVLVLVLSLGGRAQTGPTLPPIQDFPDPTNANKPVTTPDPGDVGTERLSEPLESSASESGASESGASTLPWPDRGPRPGAGATRFNVGLALSETLLNEVAAEARADTNAVCDRILGANVSGSQRTTARTRIECRRSARGARFDVVLESVTNSSTIGLRPDAAISTEGLHRALLAKPVYFDGRVLTTRRPHGYIRANNRNRDVGTPLAGIPMLGPIAREVARRQSEQARPVAETIAAERLSHTVIPRFNQSVDDLLGLANRSLRSDVRDSLSNAGFVPDDILASTTDSELRLRLRFGIDRAIQTPGRRIAGRLGSLLIHESAINGWLESRFSGLQLTDRQLQKVLSEVSGQNVSVGEDVTQADLGQPLLYSVRFAGEAPVRVRFDSPDAAIVLRLSVFPVVGVETGLQEIVLPVQVSTVADDLLVDFAAPVVTDLTRAPAGVAQRLIADAIARQTDRLTLPRQHQLSVSDTRALTVRVGRIEAAQGWLLIGVD